MKVTHADRPPLAASAVRTTYRNGLLLVTVADARWPFVRHLLPVEDDDVAVVEARGMNQLWVRPTRPPDRLAPVVEPARDGVVIALERAALQPRPRAEVDVPMDATTADADPVEPDSFRSRPYDKVPSYSKVISPPELPASRQRPAMVRIDAGEFTMGSPTNEPGRLSWERAHRVKLTRSFLMAETEVTQAQYAALMGRNPSYFRGTANDGARPVEQVNWLDAVAYCNALSAAEGLEPAYTIDGGAVTWHREAEGYRLPTEAEWEYAARAGTSRATYAGDLDILGAYDAPVLDRIAWYGGNSGSDHPKALDSSDWPSKQYSHTHASTHRVKGKPANDWGLYDMLGNVWEWTWNWHGTYRPDPSDVPLVDPAGLLRGARRTIRGGSFVDFARIVRAASRERRPPMTRHWDVGFRPVRLVAPPGLR